MIARQIDKNQLAESTLNGNLKFSIFSVEFIKN